METEAILLYVTVPNRQEGKNLTKGLLEKKLIACANLLGPMESIYYWEGKMSEEEEYTLILKTFPKHFEEICPW